MAKLHPKFETDLGDLMYVYGWTPSAVFALSIDDFNFAVKHTLRVGKQINKKRNR